VQMDSGNNQQLKLSLERIGDELEHNTLKITQKKSIQTCSYHEISK
jgi:hypothetical protein